MNCKHCNNEFIIHEQDQAFYNRIKVPAPTLCPECRYQRRIANRNEWNFYKTNCTLCKKSMVSIYNSSYPGPVYCQACWWSDKWNPMNYAREIDFSRPFFEQFFEHRYKVPRIALANSKSINSEYSNQSEENKNCYMVVATGTSEDCMYGNWYQRSKDCVDCWSMRGCEIMYESLNCEKCYSCFFIEDCSGTNNSYFCRDCRGCDNCFGCVGLRNQSYCWFNEHLSKEEYKDKLDSIKWSSKNIQELRNKFQESSSQFPVKYYHGNKNKDCTGDYIYNNKNSLAAFNCRLSEDLKYGQDAWEARDCMDLTETLDNELDYEMEGAGWGGHCIASCKSWNNHDILYSELNYNSHDIFGCLGLRNKSYCILNKQYTEKEYKELKDKLIEHMKKTKEWGEFFPISISPFPYNDSLAQSYFPLTKEQVLSHGWQWYDRDEKEHEITLEHEDLPETIKHVTDDILKRIISCKSQGSKEYLRCTKAFRLHAAELAFYRKHNLPIPHKCFACRLQDRLNRRNPRQLWQRNCNKCNKEIQSSYAPNRKETIYCEECYNKEIS